MTEYDPETGAPVTVNGVVPEGAVEAPKTGPVFDVSREEHDALVQRVSNLDRQ